MLAWISFHDLAANHNVLLEWIVLIASLVPALLTHREFCEKIREAKGFKKGMRRAELGFLWLLPVLIFASTKASEWSSEINAQQTNFILRNQSNRLVQAEIQLKGASNDLAKANSAAAEAQATAKAAIEASKPKPIDERLRAFLDSIDPKIIPALKNGQTHFSGSIKQNLVMTLDNLCAEQGASEYIRLNPEHRMYIGPEGQFGSIEFDLTPKFISSNPVQKR